MIFEEATFKNRYFLSRDEITDKHNCLLLFWGRSRWFNVQEQLETFKWVLIIVYSI